MDTTKAWTIINLLLDRVVELEKENDSLKHDLEDAMEHIKQDTTKDTNWEEIW